jgi:hypothetical protein
MVGMGSDEDNLMDYFKKIKVVTVSMSYEYDPTDVLKFLSYWLRPITKCMSRKRMKILTLLSGVIKEANSHSDR